MTKKELYHLSCEISRGVLNAYYGTTDSFKDMEAEVGRKAARKLVYEALAPRLLTQPLIADIIKQ